MSRQSRMKTKGAQSVTFSPVSSARDFQLTIAPDRQASQIWQDNAQQIDTLFRKAAEATQQIAFGPGRLVQDVQHNGKPVNGHVYRAAPLITLASLLGGVAEIVSKSLPHLEAATGFEKRKAIVPKIPALMQLGHVASEVEAAVSAGLRRPVIVVQDPPEEVKRLRGLTPETFVQQSLSYVSRSVVAIRHLDSLFGSFHAWTDRPNLSEASLLARDLVAGAHDVEDYLDFYCELLGVGPSLRPYVALVLWTPPGAAARRRPHWRELPDDRIPPAIAGRARARFRNDQRGSNPHPERWLELDSSLPSIVDDAFELLEAYDAPLSLVGFQELWSEFRSGRWAAVARTLGFRGAEADYFHARHVLGMTDNEIRSHLQISAKECARLKKAVARRFFSFRCPKTLVSECTQLEVHECRNRK